MNSNLRLEKGTVNVIAEADIKGFYNNMDQNWIMEFLGHRITGVPYGTLEVQSALAQDKPAGIECTDPAPLPKVAAVRVSSLGPRCTRDVAGSHPGSVPSVFT